MCFVYWKVAREEKEREKEREREREGKTERQKERGAEKEFTVKRVKSGSRPGCVRGDKGIPAGLSLGGASLNDNIPPCTQLIQ